MDLGCGVYCQAVVPDSSRICVSVGLGFHVEATLEEALGIIAMQQQQLQTKVAATVQQAAEIKANIKFVVEAIGQLVGM
jgi:prefoldin subunit 5